MIWLAEIGHLCLIMSLVLSITSYFDTGTIKRWLVLQFSLLTLSFAILATCFLLNDFSVVYIAKNSHTNLPWFYKICAVWGAHEGSWLLWLWLFSGYTIYAHLKYKKNLPNNFWNAYKNIISGLYFAFLGFMIFSSNPFLRGEATTGSDLNPLLQDLGMICHPPMLYMGYVGFILVFVLALSGLSQEKYNNNWQIPAQKIAKIAWMFLTLGIVLGSWWAYRELGWGGFWGWDPVENASLLPWLTGTSLVHLLSVKNNNKYHQQMILLFSSVCFFLSVLGSFLLRSGLVISVHAFAQDPNRGLILLAVLAVIIIFCVYVAIKRSENIASLSSENLPLKLKIIHAKTWLFAIATGTILLGTIYPLISQILWQENLSVGAPYFNNMLMPMLLIVLYFMNIAIKNYLMRKPLMLVIYLLSLFFSIYFFQVFSLKLICFASILFTLIMYLYALFQIRKTYVLAHIGFLIMLIGVFTSSNFSKNISSYINVGEQVSLADKYVITLKNVSDIQGPNYSGLRAKFDINNDVLFSEQRLYKPRNTSMPKVGILTSLLGSDIYIAFGISDKSWIIRAYYRPLVRWIWFGGILMAVCYILSFYLTRKENEKSDSII